MEYVVVKPEVAGGLGEHTVREPTPNGTVIHKLHYVFEGWLGDELLTTSPCFIVSEQLAEAIRRSNLTGVKFAEVEISVSSRFREAHPVIDLPRFVWLRPTGTSGGDDFGLSEELRLVVSHRALVVLQTRPLSHADITVIPPEAGSTS